MEHVQRATPKNLKRQLWSVTHAERCLRPPAAYFAQGVALERKLGTTSRTVRNAQLLTDGPILFKQRRRSTIDFVESARILAILTLLVFAMPVLAWGSPEVSNHLNSSEKQVPGTVHAPRHVHITADIAECQQHNGGLLCAALRGGQQAAFSVLVWSGNASASRYDVYRTDGGGNVHVGHSASKVDGVVSTAQELDSAPPGSCFAVTETRGSEVSPLSTPVCFNQAPQSVTLKPNHVRSYEAQNTGAGQGGYAGQAISQSENGLVVGYKHETGGSSANAYLNIFHRGALLFTMKHLQGKKILKATLRLTVQSTFSSGIHNADQHTDQSTSCAATVRNASSLWWKSTKQIGVGTVTVPANVTNRQVDVTEIVAAWVAQPNTIPNRGFVLQGDDESLTEFTETACDTTYYSSGLHEPTLVVVYEGQSGHSMGVQRRLQK